MLRAVGQGDVISLGAVVLAGSGPKVAPEGPEGQLWTLSIDSDVGWYAIISQDCDIRRSIDTEPCVLVCPVMYVPTERYNNLRRGPYSPRAFPLSPETFSTPEGQMPVADLRYVTAIDKRALLHADVDVRHPLTGPQRARFAAWVARRFGRPAHDDYVERDVLSKVAKRIKTLSSGFDKAGKQPSDLQRLVAATDEWFVAGSDKMVELKAALTEPTAKTAGLWDGKAGRFALERIDAAARRLQGDLRKNLPEGRGFVLKLEAVTLDLVPASEFRASWAPWVLEQDDPLSELE